MSPHPDLLCGPEIGADAGRSAYYFRIRDNGAVVFRVDTENRQRRTELIEIDTVNVKNGTIKAHGAEALGEGDLAEIIRWLAARLALLAERDVDDILRPVDTLNLTTQRGQTKASDAQLERVTDDLLLAMHDLRSVLVRRKSDRLTKGAAE